MKQYKITLNFTFEAHSADGDYEEEEDLQEKQKAFQRTEAYYEKHSIIQHIKSFDALGMVEYMVCEGEVISAVWDRKEFAIHMVVDTEQDEEELRKDLKMNSLEDGEYEEWEESGWIVMTRGPNDEVFDGSWDELKHYWEYGLTDYRYNPIEIKLLGEVPEIPDASELFKLTEKGKEFYGKIAAARKEGLQLNERDERIFRLMCELLQDKRLYPVGRA